MVRATWRWAAAGVPPGSTKEFNGESVAFSYELAGLGSRFFAALIDACIQIGVAIALGLLAVAVVWLPIWKSLLVNAHVAKIAAAVGLGLAVFTYFLLFIGYFILFEWLGDGKTPGNASSASAWSATADSPWISARAPFAISCAYSNSFSART